MSLFLSMPCFIIKTTKVYTKEGKLEAYYSFTIVSGKKYNGIEMWVAASDGIRVLRMKRTFYATYVSHANNILKTFQP